MKMSEESQANDQYNNMNDQGNLSNDYETISPTCVVDENEDHKLESRPFPPNEHSDREHWLDNIKGISTRGYVATPTSCDYLMVECKDEFSNTLHSTPPLVSHSTVDDQCYTNPNKSVLASKATGFDDFTDDIPKPVKTDAATIDMEARRLYISVLSNPPCDIPFYFSLEAEALLSQRQFYKALVAATLVISLVSRFYHIQHLELRSRMIAVKAICLYQLNDTDQFNAMERKLRTVNKSHLSNRLFDQLKGTVEAAQLVPMLLDYMKQMGMSTSTSTDDNNNFEFFSEGATDCLDQVL